jgi:hypothetical protein
MKTSRHPALITGESEQMWGELLQSYVNELKPQRFVEHDVVEQIAVARWGMLRARRMENELLHRNMDASNKQRMYKHPRRFFDDLRAFRRQP